MSQYFYVRIPLQENSNPIQYFVVNYASLHGFTFTFNFLLS